MIFLITILSFFLGGIWFNPKFFGKYWLEGMRFSQEDCNMGKNGFLVMIVLNLSLSFLKVLSASFALKITASLGQYILLGVIFAFFMASVHIQNLYFAKRSAKAISVEFGYQILDLVMIFALAYFLL